MAKGYREALRHIHEELRTGILVKNILPSLRPYLTEIEYSQVRDQTGNVAQVDELVDILLTKEDKHFDGFCRVCERNGYSPLARQLKEAAGVRTQEAEGRRAK